MYFDCSYTTKVTTGHSLAQCTPYFSPTLPTMFMACKRARLISTQFNDRQTCTPGILDRWSLFRCFRYGLCIYPKRVSRNDARNEATTASSTHNTVFLEGVRDSTDCVSDVVASTCFTVK